MFFHPLIVVFKVLGLAFNALSPNCYVNQKPVVIINLLPPPPHTEMIIGVIIFHLN